MWTVYQLCIAVLMVVSGSINTITGKWADKMESENSAGEVTEFNHPFLQTCFVSLGQTLCGLAFILSWTLKLKSQSFSLEKGMTEQEVGQGKYSPLLLLPPALCDVVASSIMYVGLTLTSASSYQMLRGSIMIFVGIFSWIFLKKKLEWFRWAGMLVILSGLIVVGLSDILTSESGEGLSNELLGDVLIVAAQVVAATQFVYEEKFIVKYNIPPLKAVGLEGTFGLIIMILALVGLGYIHVSPEWGHNPDHVLEDAVDGLVQIGNNGLLCFSIGLTTVSIAFFNFAGVTITKELSATTRKVLDTLRTLFIWAFSLSVGWQKFHYLQPIGFLLLVVGMLIYNDMIILPWLRKMFRKST